MTTLRAALSALLPTLPLHGTARIVPAPPAGRCGAVRVGLRFAPGGGEEAERAAVRALVEGLRGALEAGVAADGSGGGWRWVRVVGAGGA